MGLLRADSQIANKSKTPDCLGQLKKQLQSLKAPTWQDCIIADRIGIFNDNWYHSILTITDGGSDVKVGRQSICSELADSPHVLEWTLDCQFHCFHLVVQDHLKIIAERMTVMKERFSLMVSKYLPCLATIVNTWKSMHLDFAELWLSEFHNTKGCSCPPQVIAIRWGSVEAVEQLCQDLGTDKVTYIMNKLLSKDQSQSKKKRASAPATSDQDLLGTADDANAYQVKMSKWKDSAHKAINEPVFWCVLKISLYVRSPLTRYYYHLLAISATSSPEAMHLAFAPCVFGSQT